MKTKKSITQRVRDWRSKYPEKRKAQADVFVALRNKTIKKQHCEICGCEKVEAHHEDYSKPLEINWLCKKHHIEADKKRRQKEKDFSTPNTLTI